jgi:hypothetical protein
MVFARVLATHFHPLVVPAELACAWTPACAGMTKGKPRRLAWGALQRNADP